MSTIIFSNGTKVNFNGTPTRQDVEQVAKKLNLKGTPNPLTNSSGSHLPTYTPTPSAPKSTGLDKAAGVLDFLFGGGKIGEYIGSKIANASITPEQRKYLPEGYKTGAPTGLQLAGDVGQIGLELATLGGAGGGSIALKEGTKLLSGAGLRAAAPVIGKAAAVGAGFGLAGSLKGGETNVGNIAKSTALGGAVGGAIPVAAYGITQGVKAFTGKGAAKLASTGLKTPASKAGLQTNETLLNEGLGGIPMPEVKSRAQARANALKTQIKTTQAASKTPVAIKDVIKASLTKYKTDTGASISEKAFITKLKSYAPEHLDLLGKSRLTVKEAEALRAALDKNLKGATSGVLQKTLTTSQQAVANFTNDLRVAAHAAGGTTKEYAQYSKLINLTKMAQQAQNKIETQGRPGAVDVVAGLAGFLGGGAYGAGGAIAIERTLRNSQFQTGLAQALRSGANIPNFLAQQGVPQAAQAGILKLLSNFQGKQSAPSTQKPGLKPPTVPIRSSQFKNYRPPTK